MWSYYGSKTNLVKYYPAPIYDTIIEPFAGSARYALKYHDRNVILIDKYPVIIKIWKWLQLCSPADILKLPNFTQGQSVNDFNFDCEEAKLFMGFIIGRGSERPRIKVTDRNAIDRPNHIAFSLKRISGELWKIRHWKIIEATYTASPVMECTWFIDPPYEFGGQAYPMSNKHIDFNFLAQWCRQQYGQVIVCENTKAKWMDFAPMIKQRGSVASSTEAIWTNTPTVYNNLQLNAEFQY